MCNWEEIQKANEAIKTTPLERESKGKKTITQYAEVPQRIKAFRMVHPNGSITTEIVSLQNGVVVMKTTVKDENDKILSTGLAYEKEGSTYVNKTSFIENCETSAVGRALAMCGYGIDAGLASYEEVQNAIENQKPNNQPKEETKPQQNKKPHKDELVKFCKENNLNMNDIAKQYGLNGNCSDEQFEAALQSIKEIEEYNARNSQTR